MDGEAELFETADVTYGHAICQQIHATQLNALINKQLSVQLLLSVAHVTLDRVLIWKRIISWGRSNHWILKWLLSWRCSRLEDVLLPAFSDVL